MQGIGIRGTNPTIPKPCILSKEAAMLRTTIAFAATFSAATAFASIPPAYLKHLPPEQEAGSVAYITGGTNPAEAESVKRAAQDYPLELVFEQEGAKGEKMLKDMPVSITDERGKVVFEGQSDGPYFIARLPKGKYTVSTRWDAWSFSREVKIGGGQRQRVVFAWSEPGPMESLG
jgi:hypothetical protein